MFGSSTNLRFKLKRTNIEMYIEDSDEEKTTMEDKTML